jgi:hypothetical protein
MDARCTVQRLADQSLPSSLRAEMGYRTQLPLRLSGNFRYTYSRGLGLWGYRDLNINEAKEAEAATQRPGRLTTQYRPRLVLDGPPRTTS